MTDDFVTYYEKEYKFFTVYQRKNVQLFNLNE